jgi:predicted ATPase/class 3 adenylate cyclase
MSTREELEKAIAALEAQRAALGDGVVDASTTALRERLAALESAAPTDQQRKLVTVLFADVSGFTAMAEAMDAEDVNEMMNSLWNRLDSAIAQHGGTVDKHIGDAVMAVWGVTAARESDPERAVSAALRMQDEVASLAAQSATRREGAGLVMRIGINTGPVLLSQVGTTGEYTAIGDTVNTASRLEHVCPLGRVLISHATYRHVRGLFETESVDPIHLKGKSAPIGAYLVTKRKPRAFRPTARGVEGVRTPMIGRDRELGALRDTLSHVVEQGERRAVTVHGEAGVGKSRLLDELVGWAETLPTRLQWFKGRASHEMRSQPYSLLRELLSRGYEIHDSDDIDTALGKLERGMSAVLGENDETRSKAHILGQLAGFDFKEPSHLQGVLDDPQQLHDQGLLCLGELLRCSAELSPVVVLLEDIHWADESSLDALFHAIASCEKGLMVVFVARPGLFEHRPRWGEKESWHTLLPLHPLSPEDSGRLLAEILDNVGDIPARLREVVVGRAAGNPFYMEELLQMLLEEGVVKKEGGQLHVEASRLAATRVPATLTGVLQARRDSLPPAERAVLKQASVVGQTFWDGVLESMRRSGADGTAGGRVPDALQALGMREMVFPQDTSAFADAREYVFKHEILRAATYESVLKRKRRIYHAVIAEWLSERSGDRVGEYAAVIAEHFDLAGRHEQAAAYLRMAGEHAATQFANDEASAYLSRALDMTPGSSLEARYDILLRRELTYEMQGAREAQQNDLEALGELAEELDTAERRAEVALRRANYARLTADYAASESAAETAIQLAASAGAAALEAEGLLHLGRALWFRGEYGRSEEELRRALSMSSAEIAPDAREADASAAASDQAAARMRRTRTASLLNLGNVSLYRGGYDEAEDYYRQALELFRRIGNRQGECNATNNLGLVRLTRGDHPGARAFYEQALDIARKTGNRQGEAMALINLGPVARALEDVDQAEAFSLEAAAISREIGNRQGEGIALLTVGDIELSRHRYAAAEELYKAALGIFEGIGYPVGVGHATGNIGNVAAGRGDHAAAESNYESALSAFRRIGNRQGQAWVLGAQAQLRREMGDQAAATTRAEEALGIARELGERALEGFALTTKARLLEGAGDLTGAASAYRQAVEIRRSTGQHRLALEPLAGLGRVAMLRADRDGGMGIAEELHSALECGGEDLPLGIYLTVYRILRRAGDDRWREVLSKAREVLLRRAAGINEAGRSRYLENIPAHREILREWEAVAEDR